MDLPKFQQAYEITRLEKENSFAFTTNFLVDYSIFIYPCKEVIPDFIFAEHTWYIEFLPIPATIPYIKGNKESRAYKGDQKVLPTIINFMVDILQTETNIVAFEFSPHKGLDRARAKYFGDLFEEYNENGKHLHKMDFELEGTKKCSIVFRTDHPEFARICTVTDKQIIKNIKEKNI